MGRVYEMCGLCARKAAYLVAGGRVVRSKYCTAITPILVPASSSLFESAPSLESAPPTRGVPYWQPARVRR